MGANLTSVEFKSKLMTSYKDYLQCMMCGDASEKCHLLKCDNCPGTEDLKFFLKNNFEDEMIDKISYKQWVQVDRCALETLIKPADVFVDEFIEKLKKLSSHHFIAKQQASYYREIKEKLKIGEVLIIADFSENYAFLVQDS